MRLDFSRRDFLGLAGSALFAERLLREKGERPRQEVIVGLVKRTSSGAITHYEVVVALHPEKGIVVTHDPAHGWRRNSRSGFTQEWDPAGFLTLVFFRKNVSGEAAGGRPDPGSSPGPVDRRNP